MLKVDPLEIPKILPYSGDVHTDIAQCRYPVCAGELATLLRYASAVPHSERSSLLLGLLTLLSVPSIARSLKVEPERHA